MAEEAQVVATAEAKVAEAKAPAAQPSMADMLAAKQAAKADAAPVVPAKPADAGVPDKDSADAPAKVPEAKVADKPALDAEDLAQTGDAVLDAGIKMMQTVAGLNSADVERILSMAYERGDASLVDVAYIKERFGEHAAYVEQLAKAYIERTQERVNGVVKQVFEKAGGQENWNLLNQTFQQHAPAGLKKAAEALANSEDFVGAAELIIEFSQSTGLVPVKGQHIAGGGAVANGALSADGFKAEMAKLRAAVGNRSFESGPAKAQYDALVRRRQAGRMQGL